MGRNQRSIVPGGTYHVMNRGNRKLPIFQDDRDRRRFLRILIEEKERCGVEILGGCQMGNHFHLGVVSPHGNLSEFMCLLEGRFARYSNWRHGNVGHLFQGRFRHVEIEHDVHLLIALCYIFMNPVSARLVTRMEDFRWSTYAATVGLAPVPSYLRLDWLEILFPGQCLAEAQRRFRSLMMGAEPVMAYLTQDELAVDPETVRRTVRSYVGDHLRVGQLPRMYRSALRSPLVELVHEGMASSARASAIYDAHVNHGYTLAQIARALRLDSSTVGKIFRATRNVHSSFVA